MAGDRIGSSTPLALLDRLLEILLMLMIAAMTVVVCWDIFGRQVLGSSSAWASEAARFLLVFTALIGGSYCVKRGAHLGIDAFVRILPRRLQVLAETFSVLVILAFSLLVLVWGGLLFRHAAGDQRASALPLSFALLYLVFPLAGLLNSAYCIERLWLLSRGRGERQDG